MARYSNYRRVSSDQRSFEKDAWEEEVSRFAKDVEETIRAKRAGNPRRRRQYLAEREPTPFIGRVYHAE